MTVEDRRAKDGGAMEKHDVWEWLQKLSLVVATALAAFLLGPYLTNKWQNHKESVDTRSVLVERISNASGRFVGAVQIEAHRATSAKSAFDASLVQFQVESEAILSQVAAYESPSATKDWADFAYDMLWVYYVFKRNGAVSPSDALHKVADYLERPFNTFNGLLDQSFTRTGSVNQTYETDLNELLLQLRLRERKIVSKILSR